MSRSTHASPGDSSDFLGHPKGLIILFFTEMWERFSYYGMRGLFVLYLVSSVADGGFGWDQAAALTLYGTYTMLVYVMSIPGGILADKFIGQKKAVMVGGFLLVAGHGIMAVPGETPFYIAISLIILGVGALKANISTMVGGLYRKGDIRRDKGFTIFYMGINLGSALSSLIVGYIGQTVGWHWGFGLAGIGMLLGQIVFIAGQKYLKGVGEAYKEQKQSDTPSENHFAKIFSDPRALIVTILFIALAVYLGVSGHILYTIMAAIAAPFLGIGVSIYFNELNNIERDRVMVMLIAFLMVIAFWGAFEQAGGLMNLYTESKTDKSVFGLFSMTAAQFQFFNPGFILLFGIPVATYWVNRRLKGKEESAIFKMSVGNIIMGLGFVMMVGAANQSANGGMASMWWIVGAYLLHTIGELCSSPVALSFVTKLAPIKYASIMMGLYFAMTGLGNKVAGELGKLASDFGEFQVFAGIGIFSVAFGLLLLAFLKRLKRLTHGAEEIVTDAG
ncbi:peptide MFS transporter [Fulvivirgaceae bacterium BMA10]|uniref:Peptide MFS transporter n=1 Tax=Splendidivirga corallicola TaxID=3051826 RepID=A0ABT8KX03_9BACT|nr:peptide MFS transporter [Fulvivirgaceae bacterium BMA10]